MVRKLGIFGQLLGGDYAQRNAINTNAEALETIEAKVKDLQDTVGRQAKEILQLRATIMGLAELMQAKVPFDDAELELEIRAAWTELVPEPAPKQKPTDPYRGMSADEPTPADIDEAKRLLRVAEGHHFSKQFGEARAAYQQVINQYDGTKQAALARQQLQNLRGL